MEQLMNLIDEISETRLALGDARAVAGAFGDKYATSTAKMNTLAVETNPDGYVHLFHVLYEKIAEADERAAQLEKIADELKAELKKPA